MTSLLCLILITIIIVENQVKADDVTKLKTDPSVDYTYKPLLNTMLMFKLDFKVMASQDAHIILSEKENPGEHDPTVEIFIGSDSNMKTVIKKNGPEPHIEEEMTPDILSEDELRGFWINYLGGYIALGRENQETPFMTWADPHPIRVAFFGVATDEVSGEWEFDDAPNKPRDHTKAAWVDARAGRIPKNAVEAGEGVFVARALHKNSMIPGKITKESCKGRNVCIVAWGGLANEVSKYQFLVGTNFKWQLSEMGNIPANAVRGGVSENYREDLYICRQTHMGSIEVGKVQESHHVCYITNGVKELAYPGYEILVHSKPAQ